MSDISIHFGDEIATHDGDESEKQSNNKEEKPQDNGNGGDDGKDEGNKDDDNNQGQGGETQEVFDRTDVCSYDVLGDTFVMQMSYACYTCGFFGQECVCASCAQSCHAGHEMGPGQMSKFYCDCGLRNHEPHSADEVAQRFEAQAQVQESMFGGGDGGDDDDGPGFFGDDDGFDEYGVDDFEMMVQQGLMGDGVDQIMDGLMQMGDGMDAEQFEEFLASQGIITDGNPFSMGMGDEGDYGMMMGNDVNATSFLGNMSVDEFLTEDVVLDFKFQDEHNAMVSQFQAFTNTDESMAKAYCFYHSFDEEMAMTTFFDLMGSLPEVSDDILSGPEFLETENSNQGSGKTETEAEQKEAQSSAEEEVTSSAGMSSSTSNPNIASSAMGSGISAEGQDHAEQVTSSVLSQTPEGQNALFVSYYQTGLALLQQQEYGGGLYVLKVALKLLHTVEDYSRRTEIGVLGLIASCFNAVGLPDLALRYSEQQLFVSRTSQNELGMALALKALGEAHMLLGNHDAAKQYYQKLLEATNIALEAHKETNEELNTEALKSVDDDAFMRRENLAKAYSGIGKCALELGEAKEAEENFQKEIESALILGTVEMIVQAYTDHAMACVKLEQWEKAVADFDQAEKMCKQLIQGNVQVANGDGDGYALMNQVVEQTEQSLVTVLMRHADCDAKRGELTTARELFGEAIDVALNTGMLQHVQVCRYALSQLM
eukprot:TRINITY_DN1987_c0_g1_i5.p1 TRINITY_DN1987_c0_g1~~TRINITY_DN1987_c0_g1_i5.p1  ORF type:complete len:712 (+),score=247.27 TRINITY_DN1987_c0_g1_i5:3-2138(+)